MRSQNVTTHCLKKIYLLPKYVIFLLQIKNGHDSTRKELTNKTAIFQILVLCYKHHRVVDNPDAPYSLDQLVEIKKSHEFQNQRNPVILNFKKIEYIQRQIEFFWFDILDLVDQENAMHDLARDIRPEASVLTLLDVIENNIEKLYSITAGDDELLNQLDETVLPFLQRKGFVPSTRCPIEMFDLGYGFSKINWDMRVIGGCNFRGEAIHTLRQLKVRIVEAMVKAAPDDKDIYDKLMDTRERLTDSISSEIYCD